MAPKKANGSRNNKPARAEKKTTPKRQAGKPAKKAPARQATVTRAVEPTPVPAVVEPVAEAPVALVPPPRPLVPEVARIEIPADLIAQRAYEIWERKMREANDSFRNWVEAEAELRAQFGR